VPQYELVQAGDAEFFVTVVDGGPVQVGARREALSFDGVRETLLAVAEEVVSVWRQVRPDEATVEFGLSASAQTGKLTGLLVDGGAKAAFKVTMTWRAGAEQQPPPQPQPVDQSADGEGDDKAQEVTGGE
jgi:Trypsin-co-occurring domain 1